MNYKLELFFTSDELNSADKDFIINDFLDYVEGAFLKRYGLKPLEAGIELEEKA